YTFSNSDEFRFSGNVLPEETLEQQIELAATTIDPNISLNVIITYQLGSGPITSFTRVIPFHQSFEPLWCDYLVVDEAGNNLISLQKLNNTLPGFDRGEIFVYVYNENQYLNFEKLVYFDTGDIKFSPVGTINSLRKHDDAALTSALFSFDDLESKKITSQMKIKYNALGSNLESTCSGNILVLKPSFVHLEKELSFVNVTIDDTHVKLLPQVTVKVANNFFLPIKNILVSEVLPAAVFSNNNTQKTVSLSTLDEDYFKYNFIVPDDYVTLHGLNIPLETKVSYVVFGKSLSDSIKITVNANDVISAQKGVVLETLIDTKIEQLTEEINKSLVASQQSQEVNDSFEPEITYSPFLDYFSLSLIIFLFFLGILFLNFHYGLIPLFKKRRAARRMDRLAKKEADFAKQYGSFVKEEGSYEGQLRQGKQSLKQEKDSFLKQEREFRKMMKSLKSKELLANALLEKERKELQLLQNQQESIQKKMALVNRDITAQEAKKQSIDVQRKDERAALEKKKEAVLKAEEFVSSTQGKIHDLESSIGKMKSDFESSYEKNELVIHQKLDKVKGELSELDKEYDAKRKILKEEESHLEHRDS
ncbi:MAG: hypothetical protein KC535_05520, partial [Nanoarchaeota archaeon]|nr:hypothetical protein [Nanoarchaeota archaeon]